MYRGILRAVRLTLSPNDEWRAIGSEAPERPAMLAQFAIPLACIPAACWAIGLLVFGEAGPGGKTHGAVGLAQSLHAGAVVLLGALLMIFLLAASMFVLAPLSSGSRDWPRSLQVATYSGAPLFLGGVVLIFPEAAFVLILAVGHSFYLQYCGVKYVLHIKDDEAAEFVALSVVLLSVSSTIAGAAGSWAGVL